MSTVVLKNITKVYPPSNEDDSKRKRKKDREELAPGVLDPSKGFTAVQEFNLEIADQEFIVMVGPSGCGKSTTLRMIAGLEEISGGELYIDGKLVNNIPPKDRDIAMVFQNYALYPHMTVFGNMAFSLEMHKVKKEQAKKQVMEAAGILDIVQYLDRKPKAMSGGQRQRVAIGRSIVREPKVLLMDEPLSNLDAKLRNQMRAELIKLRKRINTTFIYVTHDQTEAMTLADRIVIMKDGFIQQIGTPQEVFNQPVNMFVAGFIGAPQMNFFDARLEKDEDGYYVMFDGTPIALPKDIQDGLTGGAVPAGDMVLGIRPEHISYCPEGKIEGVVDVYEMMGSEIYLHVIVAGQHTVVRVATADLQGDYRDLFRTGNVVHLDFPGNVVQLFDKESTRHLIYGK